MKKLYFILLFLLSLFFQWRDGGVSVDTHTPRALAWGEEDEDEKNEDKDKDKDEDKDEDPYDPPGGGTIIIVIDHPRDNGYPPSNDPGNGNPDGWGDQGQQEESQKCIGELCKICRRFLFTTQGTNCPMCPGHPIDCMGVPDGKAYTRVCNGVTICVDGNGGTMNNQLPSEAQDAFNSAITSMRTNCLQSALLDKLNPNYGLNVRLEDFSGDGLAAFDPCDYSMKFKSVDRINSDNATSELFHAYQEQYLNGKLTELNNSNNKVGISNIEFEEKAMRTFVAIFAGESTYLLTHEFYEWAFRFIEKNDFSTEIILFSDEDRDFWFKSLEEFRKNHPPNSLYSGAVDHSMLPLALFNLLKKSKCKK